MMPERRIVWFRALGLNHPVIAARCQYAASPALANSSMAINKARFVAFGTIIFLSRVQHGGRGPASARIRFIGSQVMGSDLIRAHRTPRGNPCSITMPY